ncbi:hypothetical protein MVES1_000411 [Malassezia vespertilionis]|uniref:uncharacterized protein n=1 Tax=Malassezia vespertilionis TaxID=2020962 RepID=UPI0024B08F8C|nr:uncharacterized protein MVES1_000411 [Malassezia vespertilionis]WFD05085.1 hypothetical protein MVES1_000411 [Malassezia vespertilionis]
MSHTETEPGTVPEAMGARGLVPMPEVVKRIFTKFPLHVWPFAQSYDDYVEPKQLVLYIAPTRPGEWASMDPVSLRWQIEFYVRGAPCKCVPLQDPYWAPSGSMPFLQLPFDASSHSSPEAAELIPESELMHYLDNYYPHARLELDEEDTIWPDKAAEAESLVWHNLLSGRLMAGALLLCLRAGVFAGQPEKKPMLRTLLGNALPGEVTFEQLALGRVETLSSAGASPSSLRAVYGSDCSADPRNPLSVAPGYTIDFHGIVGGTSQHAAPDPGAPDVPSATRRVDQDRILLQAMDALQSVATRLAVDVDAQSGEGWMLGARHATSLDCLLFAALYSILHIPADSLDVHGPLHGTIQRSPSLRAYVRRIQALLPAVDMAIPDWGKDVLAVFVGQPFDIIKVRMQTAPPGTYSGVLGCISSIVKTEGPLAFYKGTTLPLLGVGACVSIQFGVAQHCKRFFHARNTEQRGKSAAHLSSLQLYMSGAAAGIANSVLASPIEQVRIRLQTQTNNVYRGPFACLKQVCAKGGIAGVYRGFFPTLFREAHGMGIYADGVEHRSQLPHSTPLLAGAAAGFVLWIMVYPIDVIKSYMQTDALVPSQRRYRNSVDVIRAIYNTSGVNGFFRGLTPTLIRAPFANGATFLAFEIALHELDKMK